MSKSLTVTIDESAAGSLAAIKSLEQRTETVERASQGVYFVTGDALVVLEVAAEFPESIMKVEVV